MDIPSILDTAQYRHLVLGDISNIAQSIQGFQIPEFDEIDIGYYEPPLYPMATNNIATVVYKKASNPVATLTLEYSVQPPTATDANLVKVSIS